MAAQAHEDVYTGIMGDEPRLRAGVRAEIEAIAPLDALEAVHQGEAIAWIDSGVELFRRARPATPAQHLVSYAVVVDGDHILLVDHRNAQMWLPTGGHVEPGEHPRTTVLREIEEELGFAAAHAIEAPVMITCTETVGLTAGHIDVSLWYVVRAGRQQAMAFDHEEFETIRWFSFDEAPFDRTDPHLARFIAKLRQGQSRRA